MGFELTIAEGKEAGKQLSFEQPSVLIGRTDECDVVLYDPGVSRTHCRIFAEDDGFVVEDVGSSNGTQVNGTDVKRQRLVDGDAIKLGPVVFKYKEEMDEKTQIGPVSELSEPSIEEESTRIFQASEVRTSRVPSGQVLADFALGDGPPDEDDKTNIRQLPLRGGTPNPAGPPRLLESNATGRGTPSPASLARGATSLGPLGLSGRPSVAPVSPIRPPVARGARGSMSSASALSAADRARIRRKSGGPTGGLRIWWIEASPLVRRLTIAGCILLAAGIGTLVTLEVISANTKPIVKEPFALNSTPVEQTFGVGEGVTFVHPTQKLFEFEFNSAVRVVAVLHYQAKDISEGEVTITVNGAQLGAVPPDVLNSDTRPLEVIIPSNLLKKGEKNRILFAVARRNPDTWRIWNLWVETAPLPEVSADQLLQSATESYKQGVQAVDGRDIDKRNRYRAWKYFRTAWLMLEGHPDPKPELYRLARDRMRSAQSELDNQCSKLLLEAEREYSAKQLKAASDTLNEIKNWFPAKDQPCPLRAEITRDKYELY